MGIPNAIITFLRDTHERRLVSHRPLPPLTLALERL